MYRLTENRTAAGAAVLIGILCLRERYRRFGYGFLKGGGAISIGAKALPKTDSRN